MVVRIWRGWTAPEDASAYVEHLRSATLPALRQLDGFEGAEILRRDLGAEVEFVIRTEWRSLLDIRAFTGDDVDAAVVPPAAVRLLIRFEPAVSHYEVVSRS